MVKKVALITGAASGIGLAICEPCNRVKYSDGGCK